MIASSRAGTLARGLQNPLRPSAAESQNPEDGISHSRAEERHPYTPPARILRFVLVMPKNYTNARLDCIIRVPDGHKAHP
jgi:hypothetical protein